MKNILLKIFFAILLAFTVNSFVYFGFANVYSSKILNFQEFQNQFSSGIYQYRKLSGWLLMWIYDFLGGLNLDYSVFKLKFLNPESEPRMFLSFYLLNTFFAVLSGIVMVLITESKNFIATNSEKILITAAGIFTIALTQFVIVPYDVSSYFFLLLFFYFFLKYLGESNHANLIILAVIIIISTLNRESSALSVSLAATLLFSKFGIKKESLLPVAVLGGIFVVVYLGMRFFNQNFSTNDGSLLLENFTQPKNYLGLLFWAVFLLFSLLISKDKTAVRNILLFHALSLPYILMSFYSGILYEVRLYVPLFLTSLFLAGIEEAERQLT